MCVCGCVWVGGCVGLGVCVRACVRACVCVCVCVCVWVGGDSLCTNSMHANMSTVKLIQKCPMRRATSRHTLFMVCGLCGCILTTSKSFIKSISFDLVLYTHVSI